MAGKLNFTRDYALFGSNIRDFERAADVTSVLAGTVCEYGYPYDVYVDEKFVSIWLPEGEPGPNDPDNLDLIFIAKNQGYAEVVHVIMAMRRSTVVTSFGVIPQR